MAFRIRHRITSMTVLRIGRLLEDAGTSFSRSLKMFVDALHIDVQTLRGLTEPLRVAITRWRTRAGPQFGKPAVDAAGAVDAENAPTAPWKTATNAVFHSYHRPFFLFTKCYPCSRLTLLPMFPVAQVLTE